MDSIQKTLPEWCDFLGNMTAESKMAVENDELDLQRERLDQLTGAIALVHEHIIGMLPTALSFPILMEAEGISIKKMQTVHPLIDAYNARALMAVYKMQKLLKHPNVLQSPDAQTFIQGLHQLSLAEISQ